MKRTYSAFAALNVEGRMVGVALVRDALFHLHGDAIVRCRVVLEPEPRRRPVSRKGPRFVPPETVNVVLARDHHCCKWCAAGPPLELHHVVKRSQGRDDRPENLVTLCHACHERTDWPYSKGRLVIRASRDGRRGGFVMGIVDKPSKFAPDPVAP